MTRRRLRRHLTYIVVFAIVLIVLAIWTRFASDDDDARAIYDLIKDMSLLIFTVVAAYLAAALQRRESFLQSLREEWRVIVDTKAELITYCDLPRATIEDYLTAYSRLSQAIDYMRIVYANVGETDDLIGLYPYEPLHDMRRALESIDPRSGRELGPEERSAARNAIWEAFNALREHFLDEFDLEEPQRPMIEPGARRGKRSGSRHPIGPARALHPPGKPGASGR